MSKYSTILVLMLWGSFVFASVVSKTTPEDAVKRLFPMSGIKSYVDKKSLPMPWHYLLVQPLMTVGIETYYQRKTIIRPLMAKLDAPGKYSRCILMLIDRRKIRNNPEKAVQANESLVAEIAFIRINIGKLPANVVDEILHSNTPFGKILLNYKIKVKSRDRRYFSVTCDKNLSLLMGCHPQEIIYGRNNKLVSAITNQPLAEVTEILPNISQDQFDNSESKNIHSNANKLVG